MAATGLTCFRMSKLICLTLVLIFKLDKSFGDVNNQIHQRFEYKYSFKPPYLAQKDGTVPFWEYGGSEYTSILYMLHIYLYEPERRISKKKVYLHAYMYICIVYIDMWNV